MKVRLTLLAGGGYQWTTLEGDAARSPHEGEAFELVLADGSVYRTTPVAAAMPKLGVFWLESGAKVQLEIIDMMYVKKMGAA